MQTNDLEDGFMGLLDVGFCGFSTACLSAFGVELFSLAVIANDVVMQMTREIKIDTSDFMCHVFVQSYVKKRLQNEFLPVFRLAFQICNRLNVNEL